MVRNNWRLRVSVAALALLTALPAAAQEAPAAPAPVLLTLKRAVELALQNSKDIQVAKIQASVAERTAKAGMADFLPNIYAGSGLGFTYGMPEAAGGGLPSVVSATYSEQVFNKPLLGQARELKEQARAQQIQVEEVRNSVMARTASAYLELGKLRHEIELLSKERESAEKIVQITKDRQAEGLELPTEATRAELLKAQVTQRLLQLEGREEDVTIFLRRQLGLTAEQAVEVSVEDLPGAAEQEGANLVALAMLHSPGLRMAESDVRAREFRLNGERGGYLPTIQFFTVYSLLSKLNNIDLFYKRYHKDNVNAGVQIQIPLFSPRTWEAVGLARENLVAAKVALEGKRGEVSGEVRQRTRRVKEMEAGKEVARLELQLAQQDVEALQARFGEGRANLREVEKARVEENEKWMAYLDANFQRQQAQLELLRSAGQIEKILQ
ncbi:MAG: TolC family protein [Acidobacteriia bacterium]|nr:TolC family protein [Terriglobia bacterium]